MTEDRIQALIEAANRLLVYVESHELIGPDSSGRGDLKALARAIEELDK